MRTTIAFSLLLGSALLAPAALAQTAINETRPLDARGRVDISNLKGRIEVRGWERDEVKITGTLGKGVERLEVDGGGPHLSVEVRYPKSSGWGGNQTGPTDLVLMVPLRADLDIESVAADVHVTGVASGELSISSVSGSVAAAAAPQKADIETVSGSAHLTLNSADVDVQTVSGNIVLRGRLNGDISTETVSGRIEVAVTGEEIRDLSASTVSGTAHVSTALAPGGEISMESVSGDLLLRLPKDVSAQVSGESFSGSLKATGVDIEKRRGPGASFSTRYGSGSARVTVETFSGSAEVRVE
ncbi:DUF4097 family beta strand repeat protein [Pseudoxanthomonas sp. PXM03]|jgi:DUF4097 and DUF4098 domain-containing protein YvlB|uniref:DUF4097 family beta strand repeat-containing protein n=1 Tax=unclassified Pseudoxanthomonas TaxID=2645906 RepID=UPI0017863A42|nr:DUF4097 family beta strand repeat-containing protein [Pseudoxanthomonas sp. PXM03]MBD9435191.1 DUF4097 family beta strand repeat protein [Pseudoxanthomonas sp. PXM03]